MEFKFKIGEKVKIKSLKELREIKNFEGVLISNMEKYAGDIVTIESIDDKCMMFEEIPWIWDIRAIEKIKITKEELLSMPICTKITTNAKNKDYKVWIKNDAGEFILNNNVCCSIDDYEINDDLTLDTNKDYGTKIVKIEEPIFKKIYECEETKKMTVSEICKELGYDVEIIKED